MKATKEFSEYVNKLTAVILIEEPVNSFDDLMRWMVRTPVATYRRNGNRQCFANRNRSITDICIAARHNLNMKCEDAIKSLGSWVSTHYRKIIIFYCTDIRKLVFYSYPTENFTLSYVRSRLSDNTHSLTGKRELPQRLAGLALLENIK